MMPEKDSHNQPAAYAGENVEIKFSSTKKAVKKTSVTPSSNLYRFILTADIILPAFVNRKAVTAQQIVAQKASSMPDVILFNTFYAGLCVNNIYDKYSNEKFYP